MGKRQRIWGGFAVALPFVLGACGMNLGSYETSYKDRVPNPKPYQCSDGEWDGPGVINGRKLTGNGRLGRSLVFLVHRLSVGSDSASLCTGTLIGRNIVLTAAHCVDGGLESTRAERLEAIFGNDPLCALSRKDRSQVRKAAKIVIHPDWLKDRAGGVDLALIKLSEDAPLTKSALGVAVDLPRLGEDRKVYGAGYGRTTDYDDAEGDPAYLRIARLKPQNKVPNQGIGNDSSSRHLIFSQKEDGSLCRGDSGGPAVLIDGGTPKLIGVASYVWDPSASTCKSYVIHTNVVYYREWLEKTYMKLTGSSRPF